MPLLPETTVSGYQKNGMTIDGPGTTADVSGNTVNGAGRDASPFADHCPEWHPSLSRSLCPQVRNNTVTGNSYTGPSFASSGGILIFGGCGDPLVTGVQVMGNTLFNNDVGVYLNNLADDCFNPTSAMTNDKAVNNTISNNLVTNVGSGILNGFSYTGYRAGLMISVPTTKSSTILSLVSAILLLRPNKVVHLWCLLTRSLSKLSAPRCSCLMLSVNDVFFFPGANKGHTNVAPPPCWLERDDFPEVMQRIKRVPGVGADSAFNASM